MRFRLSLVAFAGLLAAGPLASAATYYVDALKGDDKAGGTSLEQPWRTLPRAQQVKLQPGDRLLLAAGVKHKGRLYFESLAGTPEAPIVIGSYQQAGQDPRTTALIDGRGTPAAIGLKNSRHVRVENLTLTADGGPLTGPMRCGVLVEADGAHESRGITLKGLHVKGVSFHPPGFVRPEADVKTANGTIRYGWGIRFIVIGPEARMRDLTVTETVIERVDHTGLKFTAPAGGIQGVVVENVLVSHSGGPGIQLSGVTGGRFARLTVDHSGSTADSRNWGRGSGLWTWGCDDIVIERSRFTNANGPGDSAGVHIDFNCRNVIVQYNLSANNAGGFCEVLGNNYNCAYRYNVSINDGQRIKGERGAFQEGKIFWLSGYVGKGARNGPFNTYFYNNTIYVGDGIEAKVAVAPTAEGVLIANNIFYLKGRSRSVTGDQLSADQRGGEPIKRVVFAGNLFLRADNWPEGLGLEDREPIFGDPQFSRPGGLNLEDYTPTNKALVQDRGIEIPLLPGDEVGLRAGREVKTDILGQAVVGAPDLGAIELR
ncbi:MAG TPA: right-handed parallel beta-helix repeat-containing protein [Lacunisphaera sp.]